MKNILKNRNIITSLIIAVVLIFVSVNLLTNNNQKPTSRLWMEYAMEIVKEKKPAPTESAWFYAAVATAYNEGLNDETTGDKYERGEYANLRTSELINLIYPEMSASTSDFILKNNLAVGSFADEKAKKEDLRKFIDIYEYNQNLKDRKLPIGNKYNEFWFSDKKPFTPNAGNWERWNLGMRDKVFDYKIPNPPKYGSSEYIEKLKEVKLAAENRTSEQAALINFWGGVPGTEQPAGIWQNRLWNEVKNLKTFFFWNKYDNAEYAKVQMYLAQSLSDSFMECWKNKFEFYTKRPSMAVEVFGKQIGGEINLAMPNPPFPSYVSGHSTISATAATVLCELIKEKCETWKSDALNAKNSRLWAGIHFSYDNDEGEKSGKEIGKYYIENVIK